MKKVVIASTNRSAGKTHIICGICASSVKRCGYMKPFGDRLVYSRKRLWDQDAAYFSGALGLSLEPDDLTLGFDHAKLMYMYSKPAVKKKVQEIAAKAGRGKDVLFIEGGSELWHGASAHLDSVSLAKYLDARLVLVVDGNDYDVMDDISFMKDYLSASGVDFAGVIMNKIRDVEDFNATHAPQLIKEKVKILGILPQISELGHYSAEYLADHLFARTITGGRGMEKEIKHIYIGDMSASSALRNHQFRREGNLVITSGDRSDMIIASIETGASCIVLTNNILPSPHLISKAAQAEVPMLLVQTDTYSTGEQISHLEALLTKKDSDKAKLLGSLIKKHLNTKELLK